MTSPKEELPKTPAEIEAMIQRIEGDPDKQDLVFELFARLDEIETAADDLASGSPEE